MTQGQVYNHWGRVDDDVALSPRAVQDLLAQRRVFYDSLPQARKADAKGKLFELSQNTQNKSASQEQHINRHDTLPQARKAAARSAVSAQHEHPAENEAGAAIGGSADRGDHHAALSRGAQVRGQQPARGDHSQLLGATAANNSPSDEAVAHSRSIEAGAATAHASAEQENGRATGPAAAHSNAAGLAGGAIEEAAGRVNAAGATGGDERAADRAFMRQVLAAAGMAAMQPLPEGGAEGGTGAARPGAGRGRGRRGGSLGVLRKMVSKRTR